MAEEVDEFANGDPETLDGSLSRFAQERLELSEGVFDGIEVGTVGREVEEMGACRGTGRTTTLLLKASRDEAADERNAAVAAEKYKQREQQRNAHLIYEGPKRRI